MKNMSKLIGNFVLVGVLYWCFVSGLGDLILNLTYAKFSMTFTGFIVDGLYGAFKYIVLIVACFKYLHMDSKLYSENRLLHKKVRKYSIIVWTITNVVLGIAARIYMHIVYIDGEDWYRADEYQVEYRFFWLYIVLAVVIIPCIITIYSKVKIKKCGTSLDGDKEEKGTEDTIDDNEDKDMTEDEAKDDIQENYPSKKSLVMFLSKASIMTLIAWGLYFIARLIYTATFISSIGSVLVIIAMILPFVWNIIFTKKEKIISEKYGISGPELFYKAWLVICLEYYVIGTTLSVLYKTILKYRICSEYGTFAMETIILYSAFIWMLRLVISIIRCSKKIKKDSTELLNNTLAKLCRKKALKILVMIFSIIGMSIVGLMIIVDIGYFIASILG